MSSLSIGAPSTLNCTPTTPTLSAASAETTVVPVTDAPVAGAENVTVGAALSPGAFDTVTTLSRIATFPSASVAVALRTCAPSDTRFVSQWNS